MKKTKLLQEQLSQICERTNTVTDNTIGLCDSLKKTEANLKKEVKAKLATESKLSAALEKCNSLTLDANFFREGSAQVSADLAKAEEAHDKLHARCLLKDEELKVEKSNVAKANARADVLEKDLKMKISEKAEVEKELRMVIESMGDLPIRTPDVSSDSFNESSDSFNFVEPPTEGLLFVVKYFMFSILCVVY